MIVIVDDDPCVREGSVDLLNSLGYSVRAFGSAEQFFDSGMVEAASCLIVDYQLSGLNGLELQKHVLSMGYQPAVIFVTAFPEKVREQAIESGAVAVLAKPFEEPVLVDAIAKAERLRNL